MTNNPQEPIHEVPVTEILPPGSSSEPARQSSSVSSNYEHRLPASMPVPPSSPTGPRPPWLIGIVILLAINGGGTWYWWTAWISPVQYHTALVDRGPISEIGNLAKAKNLATQRQRERDRMATLRRQAYVSQADLDLAETKDRDAQAQVEVAQAQVDQAVATLASAELDLGYTTIYSLVNGIVVSRNVDVGQTVAATFQTPTLFVIAQDLTQMQVNANVSESDIGGVAEGKPASFCVDAYPKQFFEGTVTQVRNGSDGRPFSLRKPS